MLVHSWVSPLWFWALHYWRRCQRGSCQKAQSKAQFGPCAISSPGLIGERSKATQCLKIYLNVTIENCWIDGYRSLWRRREELMASYFPHGPLICCCLVSSDNLSTGEKSSFCWHSKWERSRISWPSRNLRYCCLTASRSRCWCLCEDFTKEEEGMLWCKGILWITLPKALFVLCSSPMGSICAYEGVGNTRS